MMSGFNGKQFHSPLQSHYALSGKSFSSNGSFRKGHESKSRNKRVLIVTLIEVVEQYVEFGNALGYEITISQDNII